MSYKIYKNNQWIECAGQPDTSNMVTTDTEQNITGWKTFLTNGGNEAPIKVKSPDGTQRIDIGSHHLFTLTNGVAHEYSFPNQSGTFALTSDIPSLTNYVTTNTEQNITAKKTFGASDKTEIENNSVKVTTKGTTSNESANYSSNGITYSPDGTLFHLYTWPTTAGQLALKSEVPTLVSQLTNDSDYITWGQTSSNFVKKDGTSVMTGALQMGYNKITQIQAPNQNTDAVNLKYANDNYLALAGGTMTGQIVSDLTVPLRKNATSGYMKIGVGTDSNLGNAPSMRVYGTDHSTYAGSFMCEANSGDGTQWLLLGRPNGNLTWGNNPVLRKKVLGGNTITGITNGTVNTGVSYALDLGGGVYYLALLLSNVTLSRGETKIATELKINGTTINSISSLSGNANSSGTFLPATAIVWQGGCWVSHYEAGTGEVRLCGMVIA